MFTKAVKVSDSASLSSTSSITFSYTDAIALTNKYYDDKNLALKVDIQCYANTGLSTDSGQLSVFPAISDISGGTYTTFVTSSGTSLIIAGGTSVSGLESNGSYFIPLTIVPGSGITESLRSVPFIKFGYRSFQNPNTWRATLCIG